MIGITEAERLTYKDGFMSRVQELGTELWNIFPMEQVDGELKRMDFISPIEDVKLTNTRFTPIVHVDPQHTNRWLSTAVYTQAILVDPKDIKNVVQDPRGRYTTELANAFTRKRNEVVIDAFDADVVTGERAGGSVSFDTANQEIPAGGTGLTLDKLKDTLLILEENAYAHQGMGQKWFVYSPKQKQNMLDILEVVNSDYTARKNLMDGKVFNFLDFNFILSTQLKSGDGAGPSASASRYCFAFSADAMCRGRGLADVTDVTERKDLVKLPWQLYASQDIGCVRKEEEKVVRVVCNETV